MKQAPDYCPPAAKTKKAQRMYSGQLEAASVVLEHPEYEGGALWEWALVYLKNHPKPLQFPLG
jgi:hypothetical protein